MSTNYLDIGLLWGRDVGSFESQDSVGPTDYTLTADAGSYTVSGQAATTIYARTLVADTGSYTVTGIDATLTSSRNLTAEAGAYVVAGQDATLTEASVYTLTADAGSYSVSGQAATFAVALKLVAETGIYSVTGPGANLNFTSGQVVVVGGRENTRWFKGLEELKKAKPDFPYDHQFPDDREKRIHQSASILAKSGGHARARNLTPSQRTAIARTAARARWK